MHCESAHTGNSTAHGGVVMVIAAKHEAAKRQNCINIHARFRPSRTRKHRRRLRKGKPIFVDSGKAARQHQPLALKMYPREHGHTDTHLIENCVFAEGHRYRWQRTEDDHSLDVGVFEDLRVGEQANRVNESNPQEAPKYAQMLFKRSRGPPTAQRYRLERYVSHITWTQLTV